MGYKEVKTTRVAAFKPVTSELLDQYAKNDENLMTTPFWIRFLRGVNVTNPGWVNLVEIGSSQLMPIKLWVPAHARNFALTMHIGEGVGDLVLNNADWRLQANNSVYGVGLSYSGGGRTAVITLELDVSTIQNQVVDLYIQVNNTPGVSATFLAWTGTRADLIDGPSPGYNFNYPYKPIIGARFFHDNDVSYQKIETKFGTDDEKIN